ncbi:MAG: tetratricopeptide repeat protein [Melioribacteraceae bacterium]|nr:tetratricopeptide repeat protein [Melioribacteraceae bacterium]
MKYLLTLPLFISVLIGCSTDLMKREEDNQKSKVSGESYPQKVAKEKFIDGSILEQKGQLNDAINEYLEALKYDPQPGIHFTIAKNYYKLNKLASALEYSRKSVQLEPDNTEYLFLLASIYSASRLNDSSIVVYERIIKNDSTNTTAYFQLALLNEKNRPNSALAIYKKLIDMIGPEWNVLIRIIDLNDRLGNVDQTISTFEDLLKLNPSDLRLQKVLIESYLKSKKFDKAQKLADEALVSFPEDLNLYEMKGAIYVQTDEWQNAFEQYKKLLESEEINYENKLAIGSIFLSAVEKDSSNLFFAKEIFSRLSQDTLDWQVNAYLGEIELRLKNDSSSVEYFKKAISLAEWNSQLWIRLGGVLFDNGKYKTVIELLKKGVELFPNDFAINLIYGLSLSQENNHGDAKGYLEKALKINPSDLTALTALGFTLNQLKQSDEALVYLNKALILNPNDIQVLGITALIYDSKEEFDKSDSLYTIAMKIDPENPLILNNFAYSLSDRGERLDEAFLWSKLAVEKEPENSSYLDTFGWIYFKLNDYHKAKLYIEKSLLLDKDNATVLDHLGDVYFKLGDNNKAIEYWQKALENEPDNSKIKQKIEKGEL